MVKVKPLETVKANYRAGATVAPARYKAAIEKVTGFISAASSDDAEALYAARIQEAISAKRRAKALSKLSDADWKTPALTKGAARIGPGMTAAVEKHAANWSPYRAALEAVVLPARTADPMANIDARVKPIVEALVSKKKELKG